MECLEVFDHKTLLSKYCHLPNQEWHFSNLVQKMIKLQDYQRQSCTSIIIIANRNRSFSGKAKLKISIRNRCYSVDEHANHSALKKISIFMSYLTMIGFMCLLFSSGFGETQHQGYPEVTCTFRHDFNTLHIGKIFKVDTQVKFEV